MLRQATLLLLSINAVIVYSALWLDGVTVASDSFILFASEIM